MRKFLVYLLLFIVCIAGITCFIYVSEDSQKVSASVGKPNYVNAYEDFQLYHYDLTDEYFYLDEETDLYTLTIAYPVETDFNGEEYSYNIMLNNVPCYRMSTSAGRLYSEFNLTYKDLNNEPIGSTYLTIEFNFYVSEVTVKVTASNDDNYGRFLEYLKVNGLVLDIVEGQLNEVQVESTTFDGYYVKILNGDGSIQTVYYGKDGAYLYQYQEPTVGGSSRNNDITLENGQHQRQTGWTDGENVYTSLSAENFSENVTLTPYYENYFYVDYYIPFAEEMSIFGLWSGHKFDLAPNTEHALLTSAPEYEGYTFIGWSIDKENILTDSTILVNEDINLYAMYEVLVVSETLTYNTDIYGTGDYADGSTVFNIDISSLENDIENFNTITLNVDSLTSNFNWAMVTEIADVGETEYIFNDGYAFTLNYNEETLEYEYLGCGSDAPAACFYSETVISNLEAEGYYYTGLKIKFSDDYNYFMPIFAKIIGALDNIQITIKTLSAASRNFNTVTFYGWLKVISLKLNNIIFGVN